MGRRHPRRKNSFIAADPKLAVISCGKDNEFGHPHDETMELLNRIRSRYPYHLMRKVISTFHSAAEGVSVAAQSG